MAVKTVTYGINLGTRTVTASIAGRKDIVVRLGDMSPDNVAYAPLFGIQSRLSNAAAVERMQDGRILTPEEMIAQRYERMAAIADHLNSGAADWDMPRSAGGGAGPVDGLTISGIMRALGCDNDGAEKRVAAFMAKHSLERKAALARLAIIPEVATAIAAIKAERAGNAPSLDEIA